MRWWQWTHLTWIIIHLTDENLGRNKIWYWNIYQEKSTSNISLMTYFVDEYSCLYKTVCRKWYSSVFSVWLHTGQLGFDHQQMQNDFSSSLCDQTGSEAHPASYPMGTGGPSPGGKARPGRDPDYSPHLVPRSRMSRSYTSSPPKRLHGV
jgi:hypothetical protein